MKVIVSSNAEAAGGDAALLGAQRLRLILAEQGAASVIVATGASQFSMLTALTRAPGIAWENVTFFHLDEYVGLPLSHPASFRLYLWQRFHRCLPVPPRAFHYIDGTADLAVECRRLSGLIRAQPIDLCFAGIGENAHLAFNDPPADFGTDEPYLIVRLDDECRRQQVGEGWFPTMNAVPEKAVSMSIRQIFQSKSIILTVVDQRKATAVHKTLEGEVTPAVPASILQRHSDTTLFLDSAAASLLTRKAA